LQTSEKISEVLSQSQVGAFFYPNTYLSKSGIFAAYCSHKVLPVGLWYEKQIVNGVDAYQQYWPLDEEEKMTLERAQKIADQAYSWYQGHNISMHAKSFRQHFLD
jgi:hypothetical protein